LSIVHIKIDKKVIKDVQVFGKMGRGRNGFFNAGHMKNKRLKKARKEEPYWGLVKTHKEKSCKQEVYLLETSLVELMQSLDPQEAVKALLK